MSATFTVYFDEPVDYEITPDGEMIIPGFDSERDDMMTFMTGRKSNQRTLLERWNADQLGFVFGNYGIPKELLFRFALDIIKHVIPIYRLQYGKSYWETSICEEIERWVNGGMSEAPTDYQKNLVALVDGLVADVDRDRSIHKYQSLMEIEASIHVLFAIRTIVYTMVYSVDRPFWKVRRELRNISDKALLAVEYRATFMQVMRPDFHGALGTDLGDRVQEHIVAERRWQISRFIHAINMHAETGTWPPIDEVVTWA